MVASRAGHAFLESREKCGRRITEVFEGAAQLVEIGTALGVLRPMTRQNRLLLSAARLELVPRDAGQIGFVDEQLTLGDAHREDLGDVIVG